MYLNVYLLEIPLIENIYPGILKKNLSMPILKKVAKENGIDIQYVKVRDEEKNRLYTDEQKAIIEPYIQDYMSNNDEGVLTLYVPLVLVVKDGKVVDGHEGTLESHDATERKMTNDEKEQLTKIYTKLMSEAN